MRSEDEGTFHCSASNPAGIATANLTLKIFGGFRNDSSSGGNKAKAKDEVEEDQQRLREKLQEGKQTSGVDIREELEQLEAEEEEEESMIKVGTLQCIKYRVPNKLWDHLLFPSYSR